MEKYGTADYMLAVISAYLGTKATMLSESEKQSVYRNAEKQVLSEYPSVKDLEVMA